mgnify:CR=1 FL=1
MTKLALQHNGFSSAHANRSADESTSHRPLKQPPLRIDVDRMRGALSSKRFELPSGLSVADIRLHIIASAKTGR